MSLNRCEQVFFNYLSQRAEERHYWEEKVRGLIAREGVNHYVVMGLERDLWAGFAERSQVVPTLRQWVQAEGNARTSMRNLAEYLLRLWSPPVTRKVHGVNKTPQSAKNRGNHL
jgi:hypothetical protein